MLYPAHGSQLDTQEEGPGTKPGPREAAAFAGRDWGYVGPGEPTRLVLLQSGTGIGTAVRSFPSLTFVSAPAATMQAISAVPESSPKCLQV